MKFKLNVLFIILIISKAFLYYKLINIEHFLIGTVLATAFFTTMIYLLCGSKRLLFVLLNLAISLLMFTNVLYNRYFHTLFSIDTIFQAGQLKEVGGIVIDLIGPLDIALFLDLLLMCAILLFFHKKLKNSTPNHNGTKHRKTIRAVLSIALICSLAFLSLNPTGSKLITAVNHQEIFSWYIKSFVDSFEKKDNKMIEIEPAAPDQLSDEGDLHGIARRRNLIVIQMESVQNMMINKEYNGQEITPNLNSLIAGESIYFSSYYQQLGKGNTSDAEFTTNNSLYPVIYGYSYDLFEGNTFRGLPWIVKENGYNTIALHGYKKSFWNREKAYPGQGFDIFIGEEDLIIDEKFGFGLSDESFFRQSIDYLTNLQQPFYSFIVTLSSHKPYKLPAHLQEIELSPHDKDTLFGDYIQAVHYTDKEIGKFLEDLKKNGLYENSMVVLYGDHFGIDCKSPDAKQVESFLGHKYTYDMMMNIPLIINIPGAKVHETIDTAGGQVDFMPTVLNLLGITSNKLIMFGRDLINVKSGFVASQTYMIKGSFIDDNTVFEMARTGLYEDSKAWDKNTGEAADISQCRSGYEKAIKEIDKCTWILENDAIKSMDIGNDYADKNSDIGVSAIHNTIIDICSRFDPEDEELAFDEAYNSGHRLFQADIEFQEPDKLTICGAGQVETLAAWLEGHPDAIVTIPVSDQNFTAFIIIEKQFPEISSQIVPQINDLGYYVMVEYRGYRKIILDMRNHSEYNTAELAVFFDRNKISGAILSDGQSEDIALLDVLDSRGIVVFNESADIF